MGHGLLRDNAYNLVKAATARLPLPPPHLQYVRTLTMPVDIRYENELTTCFDISHPSARLDRRAWS